MKNKHQFNSDIRKWNKLVRKFQNLYKQITACSENGQHIVRMKRKLQHIYLRLEKMQYSVGVKIAGTALAFMLTSAMSYSQSYNYTYTGNLIGNNAIVDVGDAASPEFADIDRDDDLDLYIGHTIGNIIVLENDGNGNYTFTGNLQADGNEIKVERHSTPVFADIDNDGDLDLYVGLSGDREENPNTEDGKIKVFTNDGDGNFSAAGNLKAGGSEIYVAGKSNPEFADIDGDNDLDLYVGNREGTINVFTNDGNGNFSDAGYLQAGGTTINIGERSSPAIEDVDGDGDLDLYVGRSGGYFQLFTNDGSGNFSAAGNLQVDGTDLNAGYNSSLTFADMDGDKDPDLYVGTSTGIVKTFENDGSGNFASVGKIQADEIDISVGYVAKPAFGDIDDDGDLDLFVGNYYGVVNFFRNNGNGNFSYEGLVQADGNDINFGYEMTPVPALSDIDGDGDLDLYVGDKYGALKVYLNDGNENFSDAGTFQVGGSEIEIENDVIPEFADIDGDNDFDLYIGNMGYIRVFENDGSGNFSAAGNLQADGADIYLAEGYGSFPAFADIDNDGDLDLYAGNCEGISVFINDGNGIFSESGKVHVDNFDIMDYNCPAPKLADVDEDGDIEMYIGSLGGFIHGFEFTGTSSIEKPSLESGISIYPNPTQGILTINSEFNAQISVYDIAGKLLQEFNNATKQDAETIIDLSHYMPGIYIVKVSNKENAVTKKIVVE